MADTLNKTSSVLAYSFTSLAATATSSAFSIPRSRDSIYTILVNVTAATGTSPTLDLVLQGSPDKGTTYVNLPFRFTQITAATSKYLTFRRGYPSIDAAETAVTADTGGAVNVDTLFDPDYLKIKATVGGTNPAFTGKIYILSDPPSAV